MLWFRDPVLGLGFGGSSLCLPQACEQVYLDTLAAHGIPKPDLPAPPTQHVSGARNNSTSGSVSSSGATDSNSASIADYQQLLQRLSSGPNAAAAAVAGGGGSSSEKRTSAGTDVVSGSPASHVSAARVSLCMLYAVSPITAVQAGRWRLQQRQLA